MTKFNHTDEWKEIDNKLCKKFVFKDFKEAFAFMGRVAIEAESAQHHPDWTNIYNQLWVSLNTHDAGGTVTKKDFALAKRMDELRS